MRSISLIVVGMLAYAATANPITSEKRLTCHCNGRMQCYHVAKPCPRGYCAPKTPSLQCSRPKCESECDKGETCIYYKPNPKEKGCGDTICARPDNSNLM
ncbi:hypothetical protein BDF22DRAFT_680217 [Syncephalis plumigaleata]|nr:hypothetical protein BDF22DRAFT_680217 [Syncephalis plumigaleata]